MPTPPRVTFADTLPLTSKTKRKAPCASTVVPIPMPTVSSVIPTKVASTVVAVSVPTRPRSAKRQKTERFDWLTYRGVFYQPTRGKRKFHASTDCAGGKVTKCARKTLNVSQVCPSADNFKNACLFCFVLPEAAIPMPSTLNEINPIVVQATRVENVAPIPAIVLASSATERKFIDLTNNSSFVL